MLGPGVGKSTVSASLFAKLKELGYDSELITEYAKECVYENKAKTMQDQVYLLAKQYHKIKNALDFNDILVVDSPLLLSCIYFKYNNLDKIINEDIFNSFTLELNQSLNCNQVNIFLVKNNDYFQSSGRIHTKQESLLLQNDIENMLKKYQLNYFTIVNEYKKLNVTVNSILKLLYNENIINGVF